MSTSNKHSRPVGILAFGNIPENQSWEDGVLYLYACMCVDYVKVGSTRHPMNRARVIAADNPFPFCMFLLGPAKNLYCEIKFRARYNHLQHRGEWLYMDHDLRQRMEAGKGAARLAGWLICEVCSV